MKRFQQGQSLAEALLLTAFIATGVMGLWTICSERTTKFIDLILILIASPIP